MTFNFCFFFFFQIYKSIKNYISSKTTTSTIMILFTPRNVNQYFYIKPKVSIIFHLNTPGSDLIFSYITGKFQSTNNTMYQCV